MLHNAYGYGLFTGGLGAHYGAERLGCTVVPMSGGMTERQVTLINDFRPRIIMVTPSYMLSVLDEFRRQGLDPRQSSLQIGIFGLLLRESLQRLNALKNVLTLAVNTVAAGTYVVVATDRVDWVAAGLIAGGSLLGGYLGSAFGRRLPPAVLRTAICVLGLVAIGVLVSR